MIERIDGVLNDARWAPFCGWHDDHRHHCETPAYLPAMQQVRAELEGLFQVLPDPCLRILQLGLGPCEASHHAWNAISMIAVTIDSAVCLVDKYDRFHGMNAHDQEALYFARLYAPYDLLFIDGDHTFDGVKQDHETFAPLVAPGGIIAFHDALDRPGYELGVPRFLSTLSGVRVIGTEVGIGWIRSGSSTS